MRAVCAMLLCCLGFSLRADENRIWVDATINGERVRLAFDTGASDSILLRSTAERLKLKLIDPPADVRPTPGNVVGPLTEPVDFAYGTLTGRMQFGVFTLPSYAETEMEGVLSWYPLRSNVFTFDARKAVLHIGDAVPESALGWPRFQQLTGSRLLGFTAGGEDAQQRDIYVDTGMPDGVALHPALWKKWRASHTHQSATVNAGFTPAAGLLVKHEMWATEISIGSLILKEVPVLEADVPWTSRPGHAATLGVFALRRMELVVDGRKGVVYARPRRDPAPPYPHNRLGAVFVPRDMQSDPLLAHVGAGSPAYAAGIRDHDLLLKVNDLDVTKWRTDPRVMPLSRFWAGAPGTTLKLTLKRGEREYETKVVLREILGAGAGPLLESRPPKGK